MKYRKFIFALFCANAFSAPLPFPMSVELPDTSLRPIQKVEHLFNRLAFGPRPGEIQSMVRAGDSGIADWISSQLFPLSIPDNEVDERMRSFSFWSMGIGQLNGKYLTLKKIAKERNMPALDKENRKALKEMVGEDNLPEAMLDGMTTQKLMRAVSSKRQLSEVLTDFWFNHFNVDASKGKVKWYLASYERDVIRPHLFGRFRDLLGATASSPAMLFYLDNMLSVKTGFVPKRDKHKDDGIETPRGLNENYARELMELHTLGVEGGYTQKDVKEVARAFTGWGIDQPQKMADFLFRAPAHDDGEKYILGTKLEAGNGREDGERVLDLLARHPSTAKFIATKLCRRFVSDKPPRALIDRVAQTFLLTDGDLRSVYLTLFTSPEFWSKEAYHAKIKSPFEFTVSAVRALGGAVENETKLGKRVGGMGQPLYRCQPPTGYKDIAEAWVNPGSLMQRIQLGVALAHSHVEGVIVDKSHLNELANVTDPQELIPRMNNLFFHEEMSQGTKDTIAQELKTDERKMPDGEVRKPELAKYVGLFLGAPEFQRR